MKYKAYIYPVASREKGMVNPYLHYFTGALQPWFDFVNRNYPTQTGIFDILKYLHRLTFLFLNWPEDLPQKKGGYLQGLFYILLIPYLKLRKVKIVWTFHNKASHTKKKKRLKNYILAYTAKKADYIITHAKEGVSAVQILAGPHPVRILFLHHPLLPYISPGVPEQKRYDILLWGMITPYKGISQFLRFVREEKLDHLRILVAGRIAGEPSYRDEILSYRSKTIEITDQYLADEALQPLIAKSRVVLFTYLEYSILSSGALMDSLRYAPLIIGPDFGAFKDLQEEGLILTYRDFAHLKELLSGNLDAKPDEERIRRFIADHSWDAFGKSVNDFLHTTRQ